MNQTIYSGILRRDIEEWLNSVASRIDEDSWHGQGWLVELGPQEQIPTGPFTLPRTKVCFKGDCTDAVAAFRLRFLSAGG